jgi:hypothetical protein
MLDLLQEFRSLLDAFERAGVECAVCGGLAVAIHARPRATQDVDLLVADADLERAKEVARRLGYVIEAGPLLLRPGVVEIHRLSKPDPESGDLLSLDLMRVTPPLAEIWQGRVRVAWEHGVIPVVSRSGLIALKRLRASGQDLDDIRLLEGDVGED